MASSATTLAGNLARIRERIAAAAAHAGRPADDVTLVAVSKTFPAETIRDAYDAGVRHFGENRVQEWEGKQPLVASLDAIWHLVGHLQSNKARRAARLFHTIDSLDSLEIARRLDLALAGLRANETHPAAPRSSDASGGAPHAVPVLAPAKLLVSLEVRLAPEETKSGVLEADLPRLAEAVLALPRLDLRGLMAIPPFFEDPERVRPYFRKLRELRDSLTGQLGCALPELSMGMSHDFEVAIAEGATQVRLGTALFGPRSKP